MLDSPTTLAVLRKKENMMHSRNDQFKNCKNERKSLLEGRIVQSRLAQGPPSCWSCLRRAALHSIKIIAQQLAILYLLLWRALASTFLSFLGVRRVKKHERKSTILLKWNHSSYYISFKDFPKGLDQATLRDLKEKCKNATGVPVATMRLKVSGGNVYPITSNFLVLQLLNELCLCLNS